MTIDAKRSGLDLSRFEKSEATEPVPDPHGVRATLDRRAIDEVAEFRRRDPSDEMTITVRGPSATIRAFKSLCRAERRSQSEVLRRLLETYGDPKL